VRLSRYRTRPSTGKPHRKRDIKPSGSRTLPGKPGVTGRYHLRGSRGTWQRDTATNQRGNEKKSVHWLPFVPPLPRSESPAHVVSTDCSIVFRPVKRFKSHRSALRKKRENALRGFTCLLCDDFHIILRHGGGVHGRIGPWNRR